MDRIAHLSPEPFFLVNIDRHLGVTAISPAAATAGKTIGEVSTPLDNVHRASIRPDHTLAMHGHLLNTPSHMRSQTNHARYGPPSKARITPAGTSAGASTTLPAASQKDNNVPPRKKAHGIRTL